MSEQEGAYNWEVIDSCHWLVRDALNKIGMDEQEVCLLLLATVGPIYFTDGNTGLTDDEQRFGNAVVQLFQYRVSEFTLLPMYVRWCLKMRDSSHE